MNRIISQFNKTYPFLLLLSLFAPTFGAIDNISSRWMFISCLNIIYLIVFLRKTVAVSPLFLYVLIILIISSISMLYSVNILETTLFISKVFLILITVYTSTLSFNQNKDFTPIFIKFVVLTLAIELIYSLIQYSFINDIIDFTGISMNRNISSFSILIKFPLLYYFKKHLAKGLVKKIIPFVEISAIVCIILLESRLAIILLLFVLILQYFFSIKTYKTNSKYYLFILLIAIISTLSYSLTSNTPLRQKFEAITKFSNDKSINNRMDYYSTGFNLYKRSPIIGYGAGSWKIISLDDSVRDSKSNEASYYAHNDFLQFLVELGVIGFIIYACIFIMVMKTIYRKWRGDPILKYLVLSFIIIFFNSIFNFPFSRPQETILIFLVFSFICSIDLKSLKLNSTFINLLLILFSISSLLISFKEFNSLKSQKYLLKDYYSNSNNISEVEISKIDYKFPSLASNLEPISSLMSGYFIQSGNFDKALELVDYGISVNPHLDYSYKQKVIILLSTNKFSEASNVSKILLKRNPNNFEYADITFSILNLLQNETGFIEIFQDIEDSDEEIHELYFKKYIELLDYNLDTFHRLLETSSMKFPNNQFFKSF